MPAACEAVDREQATECRCVMRRAESLAGIDLDGIALVASNRAVMTAVDKKSSSHDRRQTGLADRDPVLVGHEFGRDVSAANIRAGIDDLGDHRCVDLVLEVRIDDPSIAGSFEQRHGQRRVRHRRVRGDGHRPVHALDG